MSWDATDQSPPPSSVDVPGNRTGRKMPEAKIVMRMTPVANSGMDVVIELKTEIVRSRTGALAHAGEDAEDDRERRDDGKGNEGKNGGIEQAVPDERVHRRPPAVRVAEVALQQPAELAVVVRADA